MDKVIAGISAVILAGGAYFAYPYWVASRLADAVAEGNRGVIEAHVDMTKVQDGLAQDVITYVVRRMAQEANKPGGSLASIFEALFRPQTVNGLVETLVTPAGLAKLTIGSKPGPSAKATTTSETIHAKVRSASFVSPAMFAVGLGEEGTRPDRWTTVIMAFEGLTWRVTAIRLPNTVLAALLEPRGPVSAAADRLKPKAAPAQQPQPVAGAPPAKPQPAPAGSPRPATDGMEEARFESVLKSVEKLKPAPAPAGQNAPRLPQPAQAQRQAALALGEQLTAADLDVVRERIRPCWNPAFGGRNAQDMAVELEVWANPDGTVLKAVPRLNARMSADPFYQAAVAAALRAVVNSRCQPLPLPSGKYEQWKKFVLVFDPKAMLGM